MNERVKVLVQVHWKTALLAGWMVWASWQIRQIRAETANESTVDLLRDEVTTLRGELQQHAQEEEQARRQEAIARMYRNR